MDDRTDHVLDLIDGALRGDTSGDAMRWTPEEARNQDLAEETLRPLAEALINRLITPPPAVGGWLTAARGPVHWVRRCPNCRTHTKPEDGIRPVRTTANWFHATTEPMADTIQTERCNLCSRCRSYVWPGPHLTALYRRTPDNLVPGYVLRLHNNTHKAVITISTDVVVYASGAVAHAWEELERLLAEMALPECVVPDCTDKGRYTFTAAEYGRLAGRDWQPGDQIRVCPSHGHDIYRAQGAYGLDQLADWLKPDAMLDRIDAYGMGSFADEIYQVRGRMLRLTRRQL